MVRAGRARSLAATNEEVCRGSRKGPVARSDKKFRKRDVNAGSPADGGTTTLGYHYFRAAEDGCRYGRPWPSGCPRRRSAGSAPAPRRRLTGTLVRNRLPGRRTVRRRAGPGTVWHPPLRRSDEPLPSGPGRLRRAAHGHADGRLSGYRAHPLWSWPTIPGTGRWGCGCAPASAWRCGESWTGRPATARRASVRVLAHHRGLRHVRVDLMPDRCHAAGGPLSTTIPPAIR